VTKRPRLIVPTLPAAVLLLVLAALAGCGGSGADPSTGARSPGADPPSGTRAQGTSALVRGRVPPPLDRRDVYAADRPGRLAAVVRGYPERVYVPNSERATRST
jgi:hypothetical protein